MPTCITTDTNKSAMYVLSSHDHSVICTAGFASKAACYIQKFRGEYRGRGIAGSRAVSRSSSPLFLGTLPALPVHRGLLSPVAAREIQISRTEFCGAKSTKWPTPNLEQSKGGYRKLTFAHARQAQRCVRRTFKGLALYRLYQKKDIHIKTGLDTYLIRIQTRTPLSRYPPYDDS